MIIHKCDKCGKEMTRWFIVSIDIGAANDWINVADIIKHRGKSELCQDCYMMLADDEERKKK